MVICKMASANTNYILIKPFLLNSEELIYDVKQAKRNNCSKC
jgi:hypothetical protein